MRESFKTVLLGPKIATSPKGDREHRNDAESRTDPKRRLVFEKTACSTIKREDTQKSTTPPCSSSFSKGHVQQLQSHTKKKKEKEKEKR